MFDFSKRVIMVTGASGNLGSAVARRFQEDNARLALIDRQEDVLSKVFPDLVGSPDCLMSACADLTDPAAVDEVVMKTIDFFGRLEVLVNTVGGYQAGSPLHETSLEEWDFMFDLNARTALITSHRVIPHMIQQQYGKIIHLAARPGLQGRANMSAYSASKAAVIRLTESASAELKQHGINVNCVIPGTLDTPQNRIAMPEADFGSWVTVESLAGVIAFLASDIARDIHGAAIPVYGLS